MKPRPCAALAAAPLALLVLLAAPAAHATFASPASGFPFGLRIGQVAYVKVKNAGGCTFDYTTMSGNTGVATASPAAGMGVKNVKVAITGVGVGMTNVTITTSGGTCPPAVHTYPVTVSADYQQISKDFQKAVKSEIKDFKIEAKIAFTGYKTSLKDFGVQYGDATIDTDQLFQNVHGAATQLRQDYYMAAHHSYVDAINFGSNQLLAASATYHDAPPELFMGGWKGFDELQEYVCTDSIKFQGLAKKETHKAAVKYMKDGAPMITVLNSVPPIVAGGSFYPDQAGALPTPFGLTGPLTISVLPAYNLAGDNGRVAVSGIGDTAQSGNLDVTLGLYSNSMMMTSWSLQPTITSGEWDTEFSGLTEGTYLLSVGYVGDTNRIELPLHVGYQF
ncbi:MAG: hypothetical protein KC560_03160 [Myxococcales bacterium]|nr:hypothetical protein [Myxococcales bacterium]